MTPGYRLVMATPPVSDYLGLRQQAGLSPKTEEQATAALPGSWAPCRDAKIGGILGPRRGCTRLKPHSRAHERTGLACSL
jgi:hypothetical protein